MPKRSSLPEEIAPSLTKQQGQNALRVMKEKGEKLLAQRPVQEAAFHTWTESTIEYIKKTFGSMSNHINTFIGQIQVVWSGYGEGPDETYVERSRAERLAERISALDSLIEQLETDIRLEIRPTNLAEAFSENFWTTLHAKVTTSARARFEAGQYADAVEAAFKELNTVVKEMVRKKTGQEHDGAGLMQKAFSPNAPVVALDDLSTESGKNIQQGYMQIFAGAMVGIRNPKAHANLTITKERCIHFLFLASLLFHKLDERP